MTDWLDLRVFHRIFNNLWKTHGLKFSEIILQKHLTNPKKCDIIRLQTRSQGLREFNSRKLQKQNKQKRGNKDNGKNENGHENNSKNGG